MTKTFVSEAFGRIADRAVQMHGAAGIAHGPADRAHLPGRARRADLRRRERGAPDGRSRASCSSSRCRASRSRRAGTWREPARDRRRRHRPHARRRRRRAREPLLVRRAAARLPRRARARRRASRSSTPIGDGHSNVTFAVRRGDARARRAPAAARAAAAERPRRAARGARAARARRPRAGAARCSPSATTPAVIGAPFYVMEQLDGDVVTTAVPARRSTRPTSGGASARSSSTRSSSSTPSTGAPPGWRASAGRTATSSASCARFGGLWERNRTRDLPAVERVGAWLAAQPARVAAGDDRARRLPARQRDVRARRRRRAWSRSSTGRCRRSATRSPTSATCARSGSSATTRRPGSSSSTPSRAQPGFPHARRARRALRGALGPLDGRHRAGTGCWRSGRSSSSWRATTGARSRARSTTRT